MSLEAELPSTSTGVRISWADALPTAHAKARVAIEAAMVPMRDAGFKMLAH